MLDLRNCKPGDKLRRRDGGEATYVRCLTGQPSFEHMVEWRCGAQDYMMHDGRTWSSGGPYPSDIVAIVNDPAPFRAAIEALETCSLSMLSDDLSPDEHHARDELINLCAALAEAHTEYHCPR